MMSIAVSATVAPSRRLRVLLAAFGLANLGAAFAVGLVAPDHFTLAPLAALLFCVAATCMLHACKIATNTRRIDISGLGQVRLTVQQGIGTTDAACVPVSLLPGSTVWPQLMLLLLRTDGGALTVLPILRDSVSPEQFRALAVAIRSLAGRNDPFDGAQKIL
jgi:toxin CptA